jgi:hypothetical protein
VGLSLFKRSGTGEPVVPGAVYRRTVARGVTETARVLAVTTVQFNIPHVRFVVQTDIGSRDATPGDQRTLSVDSFQRLFQERVAC